MDKYFKTDFEYELPLDKIASFPLEKKEEAKMLVYKDEQITDSQFKYISEYIPENSVLVVNETKVIPARINFLDEKRNLVEIFLLKPVNFSYEEVFKTNGEVIYEVLFGNAKKWKGRTEIKIDDLIVIIEIKSNNSVLIKWSNGLNFLEILEKIASIPLPPYLKRKATDLDKIYYQTQYAKNDGSVAAPTAGLHFTEKIFNDLKKKGVKIVPLTLHIGIGTFRPLPDGDINAHEMHEEQVFVPTESLEALLKSKKDGVKIFAVGTTAMRSLESLKYLEKEKQTIDQYIWKNNVYDKINNIQTMENLINQLKAKKSKGVTFETKIMISPGYKDWFCDALITNFHQSGTSLLTLVSAVTNGKWKEIYNHALLNDYRFLSYGDGSLLFTNEDKFNEN